MSPSGYSTKYVAIEGSANLQPLLYSLFFCRFARASSSLDSFSFGAAAGALSTVVVLMIVVTVVVVIVVLPVLSTCSSPAFVWSLFDAFCSPVAGFSSVSVCN